MSAYDSTVASLLAAVVLEDPIQHHTKMVIVQDSGNVTEDPCAIALLQMSLRHVFVESIADRIAYSG